MWSQLSSKKRHDNFNMTIISWHSGTTEMSHIRLRRSCSHISIKYYSMSFQPSPVMMPCAIQKTPKGANANLSVYVNISLQFPLNVSRSFEWINYWLVGICRLQGERGDQGPAGPYGPKGDGYPGPTVRTWIRRWHTCLSSHKSCPPSHTLHLVLFPSSISLILSISSSDISHIETFITKSYSSGTYISPEYVSYLLRTYQGRQSETGNGSPHYFLARNSNIMEPSSWQNIELFL